MGWDLAGTRERLSRVAGKFEIDSSAGKVEVTREIRRRLRKTEVLVLAIQESENLVHEFLKAGARGYLLNLTERVTCLRPSKL